MGAWGHMLCIMQSALNVNDITIMVHILKTQNTQKIKVVYNDQNVMILHSDITTTYKIKH